jgi:hypothetical protein
MQRVLSNYTTGDELEIRYYIDPRARHPAECLPAKHPAGFRKTVESIIAKLGGMKNARHTRVIDLHLGDLRKRILFNSAGERREEWCEKRRKSDWVEPNDFGGLRVAVATEVDTPVRTINTVDRITVKYRYTFALDCLGMPSALTETQRMNSFSTDTPEKNNIGAPWVIEMSAVKVCDLSNVQEAKAKLLACCDPLEAWGWWDHWEFERELVTATGMPVAMTGDDNVALLELDDIYHTYNYLAPDVDHEMLDAVRRVAIMIDHPRASSFQRLSPRNTITRLLPKAVEPTLETWIDDYSHMVKGMVLRDKVDGTRELVWIREGKLTCVGAKNIDDWDEPAAEGTYVFDCEFLDDVWYVLHPLVWCGRSVTHLRDSERLALIQDPETGVAALKIPGLAVCPVKIIEDPARDIRAWWARRTPYHRDGLILCTDSAYFVQKSLKWKPAEESTVDMLIVQCPDWLVGKAPYIRQADDHQLYILNVGCSADRAVRQHGFQMKRYLDIFHLDKSALYVPQPFSPPDAPSVHVWSTPERDLHGHIGEFLYGAGDGWALRRKRDDKPSLLRDGTEIGNDLRTALDIWSKNANPFPLEYLWKPPAKQASRYDSLAGPVARIVSDLLEEESVTTAMVHMCPFIPFDGNGSSAVAVRGALLPRATAGSPASYSDYRPDLSNNSRVVQIIYDQVGRIDLPKEFIGGAQLLVTMDPGLLGHVSCLGKVVASGGRLVVVVRMQPGEDAHPEVSRTALMKDMDRAGFQLVTDHGAPETGEWDVLEDWERFSILSFRKENRGASDMKPEDVRKENPHLEENLEANFSYKFSRQKTKDIAGLIGPNEDCMSLCVDPERGERLIDIEFLSTLDPTAQVLYVNSAPHGSAALTRLRRLFPKMQFRALGHDSFVVATSENIEAVVSHVPYDESIALIKRFEPHCGLLDFDHHDLRHRVIKGRVMLHPYAALDSTRVSVMYGRDRQEWNILPDIFQQEMMTFHRAYRPTAFKYATRPKTKIPPPGGILLDNCYDCRASVYIMTKYAKSQKITLDEAYARLS